MNEKSVRINYDDLPDDIVEKINSLLKDHSLKLDFDKQFHDGFEILSLVKL